MKNQLKIQAISLRRKGLSYNEILREIPVAKSTLSLWLHAFNLSKNQKQRLTDKKLHAMKKGWETRRKQRVEKTNKIKLQANLEITKITKENLWLMGIMLYWAEGAKQKYNNVAQGVYFSNTDPFMIKLFLKWLKVCLKIDDPDIQLDIYIHEAHRSKKERAISYWSQITGFHTTKFDRIYYKKHKLSTNRKNTGSGYFGILRIRVKRSTDLNRKIAGWIEGISIQCGVV